jgi:serine/threonine protein kinase
MDEINDEFWALIKKCCALAPEDRPTASEIKELLASMQIQDDRPRAQSLPGTDILNSRSHPEVEWDRVELLLSQIQVELLRVPLSKLLQHHTKDVAVAASKLQRDDVQTIVDFLDVVCFRSPF